MKITPVLKCSLLAALAFAGVAQLRAAVHDAAPKNLPAVFAASDGIASDTAAAHPGAAGDPLLEALLTELDRSKSQLKIEQVQAPYYI